MLNDFFFRTSTRLLEHVAKYVGVRLATADNIIRHGKDTISMRDNEVKNRHL